MIDRDVVNVIHYICRQVKVDWGQSQSWLFCVRDTPVDAEPYLEGGNQLPAASRLLVRDVDQQLREFPKADFVFGYPLDKEPRQPGQRRPGFVAMPYGESWFATVQQAIVEAGAAQNFDCIVSLNMATAGPIVQQIWQQLRQAEAVVADLTHNNPNVYYEVGLAHALGKQIIFITQDNDRLPFDVSTSRCIKYNQNDPAHLKCELEKAFAAVPQRYRFDPAPV